MLSVRWCESDVHTKSRCDADLLTVPRCECDLVTVSRWEPDLLSVPRCEFNLVTVPRYEPDLLTVSRCEPDLLTVSRCEPDLLTVPRCLPDLLTVSRCEPDLSAGGPGDLYRADPLLFWCVSPGVLVPHLLPMSPALPPLLRYIRGADSPPTFYCSMKIWFCYLGFACLCPIIFFFLHFPLSFPCHFLVLSFPISQCCGSEMIYSGLRSGSSFEFSEFRIWIRNQAKVPDPCGSGSGSNLYYLSNYNPK